MTPNGTVPVPVLFKPPLHTVAHRPELHFTGDAGPQAPLEYALGDKGRWL